MNAAQFIDKTDRHFQTHTVFCSGRGGSSPGLQVRLRCAWSPAASGDWVKDKTGGKLITAESKLYCNMTRANIIRDPRARASEPASLPRAPVPLLPASAAQSAEGADSLQPDSEAAPHPALLVAPPRALRRPHEVREEARERVLICRVPRGGGPQLRVLVRPVPPLLLALLRGAELVLQQPLQALRGGGVGGAYVRARARLTMRPLPSQQVNLPAVRKRFWLRHSEAANTHTTGRRAGSWSGSGSGLL